MRHARRRDTRPVAELVWIVPVWALGAAVYFRTQWRTGMGTLQGNVGDTRLIAYLCEHWFRVLHGQASWLNPPMFAPVKGVLGWSDTFVLFQVVYAPARLVGFDSFQALQVTVVALSLFGFATFALLARRLLGAGRVVAAVTGLAFVFSNALYLHSSSSQLSGVALLPAIVLLLAAAWRRRSRSLPAAALGAAGGLLWGLALYSTYYMAWFATLAAGIVAVLAVISAPRRWLRRPWRVGRPELSVAASAAGGLVVGLIPFARTYLPVRDQGFSNSYASAMGYAGRLHDLVNVGTGNLLWTHVLRTLDRRAALATYESSYAVTPILAAAAAVVGVVAVAGLLRRTSRNPATARVAALLAATTAVMAVVPLDTRLGSLWAVVYHLPGASALRAIFRGEVVTTALACLTVAAGSAEVAAVIGARRASGALRILAVAVLAGILVEQINTSPVSDISDRAQVALLDSVQAAPAACRTFAVTYSGPGQPPFFEIQIDAMLVAQRVGIPTVNGYTGHTPPGWDLVEVQDPAYPGDVARWAAAHRLTSGLCRLDLATMRWTPPPAA